MEFLEEKVAGAAPALLAWFCLWWWLLD